MSALRRLNVKFEILLALLLLVTGAVLGILDGLLTCPWRQHRTT